MNGNGWFNRQTRALRAFACAALAAGLVVGTTGCSGWYGWHAKKPKGYGQAPGAESPLPGQGTPPRIAPPAPAKRTGLKLVPEALPAGAHAHFPAYDGDRFFVSLPVGQQADVSAAEVLDKVVVPVLKAMGFERGPQSLSRPPDQGVRQPVARFAGLAQTVAFEYANNRELFRPKTQKMLDVFSGKAPPDEGVNADLLTGEGMTFPQFVAGIERLEIQYPFQQVEKDVPIEHTLLLASRWEGQTVTTVRGVLFNQYHIVNHPLLKGESLAGRAVQALTRVRGIGRVPAADGPFRVPSSERGTLEDGPFLVLLPYGTDAAGVAQLRYAYRMIVRGSYRGQEGPFLLWLDAETGKLLELDPLFADAGAAGAVYNRDPGVVPTTTSSFEVDAAAGGQYTLKLAGVLNRVDYQGDGFNALDVSIPDSSGGSSPSFANFDQSPFNGAAQALCGSGTNKGFQQVNFYATIYRYYQTVSSQGIYTPFPATPWSPKVEIANYCNANAGMTYGACQGYFDAACPNFTDGTTNGINFMNFAHDNTVIGHELAHSITPRLAQARPSNWCGAASCAIPVGWGNFHDLADFWADHLESTNCTGGWVGKNMGGANHSLNCAASDEGGYLPRLHEVTVPFNPGSPGDHFPEHRFGGNTCDYCDGQIAAAALWQVRLGMRSKCRPSGLPQFGVRFQRALKETGFLGFTPADTDLGRYQQLYDLELEMVDEWATSGSPGGPPAFAHNGPHTTNKVTAGFARAGLFLAPYQCLDGDPATVDPTFCPTGENGGDAVVDIDDNDPSNDLTINGVLHPTFDFLRLGGTAPSFLVWTGPRFRFNASGGATLTSPSPCNSKFRVEASTDPAFAAAATVLSPWIDVDTDPTTPASPECYGTWTPNAGEWAALQAGGVMSRIYYRARTRDAADGNERLSTQPGNGLWTVPPPYAVVTLDGHSDY